MGFTADNPPGYIRPLLDEYESLRVDKCGAKNGSWVELTDTDDGTYVKVDRNIDNSVTVHYGNAKVTIRTGVTIREPAKRNKQIGATLVDRFGGYESFGDAYEGLYD